jgi:erythronate-4-phosphate dehydrogenase
MSPDRLAILVDENVPYAVESFGIFGTVRTRAGRLISAADVKDVDVLIVRSVTRVDEALLARSAVRFVGTATIGCDHIDLGYLKSRNIAFASAPGSNANSVAEYVVAALLLSARARQTTLEGATIAVIGVGSVGSRVADKAEALGMRCVLNDPPRRRESGDPVFVALADALAKADYVTLHVPLVRGGADRTADMAREPFFSAMRPGAVFLNTSRGAVVDETALAAALDSGRVSQAVLDVWRNEPAIDPAMVRRAFVATPHIAGYSFDGKVAATDMLLTAVWMWRHQGRLWQGIGFEEESPQADVPRLDFSARLESDEELLRSAVLAVYDIEADDRALRHAVTQPDRGAAFDLLRKTYRRRREFHHTTLVLGNQRSALIGKATRLGFRVETQ